MQVAEDLRFELGLGGGIDWSRYAATGSDRVEAADGDNEVRAFASAFFGLSYQLAPIALMLVHELDVALQDTHYDVVTGTRRDRVIKAPQLQPGLSLLLAWEPD
jgi:hypothetical protein